MAKSILVANWKNHPSSLFEAQTLLKELSRKRELFKKLSFFIAPPLVYFESVSKSNLAGLTSQNVEANNIDMVKNFGARISILGHSDYRLSGETDETINKKIKAVLRAGITPLLCIGEKTRDSDGEHFETLREQLKKGLASISKPKMIIAYEPVWAIGKSAKDSIQRDDLEQTVIFIKKVLSDTLGRKTADQTPILYGGAVEPLNVNALMKKTGIKGFLVGHASLKAKSLISISKSMLE